ncbi:uncharacterized protein LOC114354321 [Ostrinia furnacalis]|uniref:uncharacterized protein LOC114354321 n=1 Tax=Ostrinia furnacalis TaxID=93504 RepID=UPI00103FF3A2|nr:uncharacterized protein LOC114354321 [Ostrinia furnacalis]
MDEKFIDCVKRHPCLWNTRINKYRDLDLKSAAWKDVAAKTQMKNSAAAKNKWKYLRDVYRETIKNFFKNKNTISDHMKTWKYTDQMSFLLPHMSVSSPPDSSLVQEDAANTEPERTPLLKMETFEIINPTEPPLLMENNPELTTVQRDELLTEVFTSSDPLKVFMDSMYLSMRRMPEYSQGEIKKKILNWVVKTEDALPRGMKDIPVQKDKLHTEAIRSDPLKVFMDSMYLSIRRMPKYSQGELKIMLLNWVQNTEDSVSRNNLTIPATNQTDYSNIQFAEIPGPSGTAHVQKIVYEDKSNSELLEIVISDDSDD